MSRGRARRTGACSDDDRRAHACAETTTSASAPVARGRGFRTFLWFDLGICLPAACGLVVCRLLLLIPRQDGRAALNPARFSHRVSSSAVVPCVAWVRAAACSGGGGGGIRNAALEAGFRGVPTARALACLHRASLELLGAVVLGSLVSKSQSVKPPLTRLGKNTI